MNDHNDDQFPDGTRVVPEGEAAPTSAAEDLVGRTLERRYRIKKRIGAGGMATVYLARHGNLDRPAAVKVPHAALLTNPEIRERFEREVRSLVRFQHPGVVKIFDVGRIGETPFMVMEYLPGGSLQERLTDAPQGRQTPMEVLKWLEPLARTLDSLHDKGLIHRDVKADNVLFGADDQPYLADFGVAKALQAGDGTLTSTDVALGSVRTMAPEQCIDGEINGAADQYALASTVYEALSGRPVFYGKPVQVLTKKATRDAPPLRQYVPGLPVGAAAAVMRGLAREPAARLGSCAALARAFRDGLEADQRSGRLGARRWVLPLTVSVLLVAVIAAWLFRGGTGSEEQRSSGTLSTPTTSAGGASGGTPAREPPAVPVTVAIESPLEGAWINTPVVPVRGRAQGGVVSLLLNGEAIYVDDGAFEDQVVVEKDGDHRVHLRTKEGRVLADRTVHVDTAAPLLTLTEPSGKRTTTRQPFARIEGRVIEAHLASLTANGTQITPEASGRFMWPVTLEAGKPLTITFKATDKAGNESAEVTRTLTYEKPAEAFDATLSAAEGAARKGAWREASRLLDAATSQDLPKGRASRTLLQGVERWKAPPTLEIASPADGAQVTGLTVRLAGRLKTGRPDDRLVVDGNGVRFDGEGHFSVSLPYTRAGTYRIGIEVLDDRGARRRGATRTVTLLRPVLKTPSWAKVSVEQKREASRLSVPVAFENTVGMRFVLIPAGEIWMGSPDGEEWHESDETRHKVRLSEAYYLQITEVTNGQYGQKGGNSESRFKGPEQPVDTVSWNEATAYAKWLSSRDAKRTYVLPTEAQWEYACRAGTLTPFAFGETISVSQANYNGNYTYRGGRKGVYRQKTVDVGTLAHNGWGLYDMHGNVWEWCQDRYGEYVSSPLTTDPAGSSSGASRVVRGGSWRRKPALARSANRLMDNPGLPSLALGFRLLVRLRP